MKIRTLPSRPLRAGLLCALVAALLVLSLAAYAKALDDKVRFAILQMNDVYELTPVGGQGGLARVATLRKHMLRANPNTFTVLAGDLFSPSALGTAKVNDEPLAGKQMVAIMNALGLDYMTFGNHEFDPTETQFQRRLNESNFRYVSSNVKDAAGRPFAKVPEDRILEVSGRNGKIARIGLFGLTIPSNRKSYVTYSDPFQAAEAEVMKLRPRVDILIALTHLAFDDDRKLGERYPQIDLILGGHEHVHHAFEKGGVPSIFKADANARTVWIHYFTYDPQTHKLARRSELRSIGPEIPEDPTVKAEVDAWVRLAYSGFRKEGFEPEHQIATSTLSLDGSEASVRSRSTRLTEIIGDGMRAEMPEAELSIYNGGSIRIDDTIPPGPITEYDVIRILPFGGKVLLAEMQGSLLEKVLDQGMKNRGSGGFLQVTGATFNEQTSTWMVGGQPIDGARNYRVAINDFLLTGGEQNLEFLHRDAPGIKVVREGRDIRQTTVAQLHRVF